MIVVRALVLLVALGTFVAPALARPDVDELRGVFTLSPQARAVEAALDTATDAADPIETYVVEGVRRFYAASRFELLWLGTQTASRQMSGLRRVMDDAASFGLDPAAYQTPLVTGSYTGDASQLAAADVEFTRAVARFVVHVASGRILPTDISPLITREPERPDIVEALTRLSQSQAVAVEIGKFEPTNPQYRGLRAALTKLRASTEDATRIVIPEGDLLKPGMTDPRVPLLRQRLGLELAADAVPDLYDDALVDAVKLAQAERELTPDGILGPRTLAVLNGRSIEDQIATVVANIERWRWMPRDLGGFHIFVNVPEYMVRVVNDGRVVHETRVIVGKPANPTPSFSHVMSHVIVNPYWNVPVSIIANEMMPAVRSNPGYFSRGGYEVFARIEGRYRQINPYWVDWSRVNPRLLQVRQVPGDSNALGRIKFMFPNQHDVYLHDTPSKKLFQRDLRALSHGCVRVYQPLAFADAILPFAAPEWNSTRLEKLYGGKERRIDFDQPIPVHLAYFTDTVETDGTLHHFDDIYGYDARMAENIGY